MSADVGPQDLFRVEVSTVLYVAANSSTEAESWVELNQTEWMGDVEWGTWARECPESHQLDEGWNDGYSIPYNSKDERTCAFMLGQTPEQIKERLEQERLKAEFDAHPKLEI